MELKILIKYLTWIVLFGLALGGMFIFLRRAGVM